MSTRQINITLGTAGHIDHGKTALVRLLTGCETDRLKEEKERGMSIELGFAPCTLDEVEFGIVDVPGHEGFIRTMVAGVAGIDAVILVVAADDGIMPQTREHLDILTLLGVAQGVIALTKIDRVAPDRIAAVSADLRAFTRGTFLHDAPILPVSNVTGEGFGPFLQALKDLVRTVRPRSTDAVFRLPVERAFSLKGLGTVISGIPVSGSISVGDEAVILPHNQPARIASIQVYGRPADRACSGQCAALNVRHWDSKAISRGDTLALPGFFEPAEWFACTLRLLDCVRAPLKNGSDVRLHTGASETTASLYSLEAGAINPAHELLVQLRTAFPIVAGPGDRFIVRSLSPTNTIGGGVILESLPHRLKRSRPGLLADLADHARALADPADFLEFCLRTAPASAASVSELAHRTKNPLPRARAFLDALVASGNALALSPDLFIHARTIRAVEERLTALLAAFHESTPQSPGMTLEELLESSSLAKPVLSAILGRLLASSVVVHRAKRFALAGHAESFTPEERRNMDLVEPLFASRPFAPPSPEEVAALAHLAPKAVERAIKLLVEHERLVPVAADMLFHRDAVERARALLVDFIRKEGLLESVKFKYLLDTSRKFALPLLDYFDKIGVTLRVGNTRYLKDKKS